MMTQYVHSLRCKTHYITIDTQSTSFYLNHRYVLYSREQGLIKMLAEAKCIQNLLA